MYDLELLLDDSLINLTLAHVNSIFDVLPPLMELRLELPRRLLILTTLSCSRLLLLLSLRLLGLLLALLRIDLMLLVRYLVLKRIYFSLEKFALLFFASLDMLLYCCCLQAQIRKRYILLLDSGSSCRL